MYVNGTLRSWIHYIELRGVNGTQQEHIKIAPCCSRCNCKYISLAEEFKGKEI